MTNIADINPLDLPSMTLENRGRLPNCAAVYFVIDNSNTVLYIGQTISLVRRWMAHHRAKELLGFESARIAWLEVSDTSLLAGIERACIDHFAPYLNQPNGDLDKPLTVRLSYRLHELVKERARAARRKPADWIRYAIEEQAERERLDEDKRSKP